MVDQKLIDYINENVAKGHSMEEIRKFVVAYGWSQKEFDEAILIASGSEKKAEKPKKGGESGMDGAEKKKGHKKLILALIVLIIVIFVFLYVATDIISYFTGIYPETALPFNMSFPNLF